MSHVVDINTLATSVSILLQNCRLKLATNNIYTERNYVAQRDFPKMPPNKNFEKTKKALKRQQYYQQPTGRNKLSINYALNS